MSTCAQCGKKFQPSKKSQVYCTPKCRLRSSRVRHNEDYNRWRREHYARNRKDSLQIQDEENQVVNKN